MIRLVSSWKEWLLRWLRALGIQAARLRLRFQSRSASWKRSRPAVFSRAVRISSLRVIHRGSRRVRRDTSWIAATITGSIAAILALLLLLTTWGADAPASLNHEEPSAAVSTESAAEPTSTRSLEEDVEDTLLALRRTEEESRVPEPTEPELEPPIELEPSPDPSFDALPVQTAEFPSLDESFLPEAVPEPAPEAVPESVPELEPETVTSISEEPEDNPFELFETPAPSPQTPLDAGDEPESEPQTDLDLEIARHHLGRDEQFIAHSEVDWELLPPGVDAEEWLQGQERGTADELVIPRRYRGTIWNGTQGNWRESLAQEELASDTTVQLAIDLETPQEAQVGEEAEYRIVIRNEGREPIPRLQIEQHVQATAILTEARPDARFTGDRLDWSLAPLAPGEERVLAFTAHHLDQGDSTFQTRVETGLAVASRTQIVDHRVTLEVQAPETASAGSAVPLQFRIHNAGRTVPESLILDLQLPRELTHPSGHALEHAVPTLEPDATHTAQLHVRAAAPADVTRITARILDGTRELQSAEIALSIAAQSETTTGSPQPNRVPRVRVPRPCNCIPISQSR